MNSYTIALLFGILAYVSAADLSKAANSYKACLEKTENDYENKGHLEPPPPSCIKFTQEVTVNAGPGYPYNLKFKAGEKDSTLQGIKTCLDAAIKEAGAGTVYEVVKQGSC